MIALLTHLAAASPDESDLPDAIDLEIPAPEEAQEERPPNRGRWMLAVGSMRWWNPGTTTHASLQFHMGPLIALHIEGGGRSETMLVRDGRRLAFIPELAIGPVLDPFRGRIRPQLGIEATAQAVHIDVSEVRAWIEPGVRTRTAVDLQVFGRTQLTLEGWIAGMHLKPERAANWHPRLSGWNVVTGWRAGWGVRW